MISPMLTLTSSILPPCRSIALTLLAPICCIGSALFAQVSPAPTTQVAPATNDPTRPEIQPSLNVDRDPIPSPDPEDTPATTASSSSHRTPSEIKKGQDGTYTLHTDVDEVLLTCAVVDEKGRPVMDLKREDFRIWEDSVPQATNSFQHQDLPVSMGIIIDNSGSMRDKRSAVNAAVLNLLRASNPQDAAFLVNFSDRAFLDQGFTSDISAINRGLARFDSQGTTAMYDAVAASADELAKHARQPKQALLIVTDGADNASRLTLEQAIRRVQNLGGPVVYTIGLLFDAERDESLRAKSALDRLSEETGGIAYFPGSLQDVDKIAEDVAREIRNQYTIGYRSSKPSSIEGYRVVHVEVRAPGHGRLIVRTRKGYYAKRPAAQPTQTAQGTKP